MVTMFAVRYDIYTDESIATVLLSISSPWRLFALLFSDTLNLDWLTFSRRIEEGDASPQSPLCAYRPWPRLY